ncbi:protein-glutamate O-methyltransferase CheR [Leptospira sp. 2 VSF19]|uniref:protein-glutamate O-methyltransferase n=1 Tax=Leptospira soteropolitanensis TaxID=2950025 RepID=A0AAW5VEP0_9LEPT|nr:protein-glutamate O-methyltransferase CheR [Leptospira soteropolitanensis]MCW7492123.1 protein-glutamate O-methyltransferase CheR [Leptospira soteropolitanensis]MCW7499705.1 protein-glutamate O-methyltransferase CheR [Leptospira soteropolitanensis]MCW7521956.1 protein-glutamate O-methyltransferase CheR [Leptospira soteropolitanensis]MCW7525810.1 protein-glutamate O-methyltransferase CheR [Leptospira soteropolitanensis]MCW7530076.1 protein-glutamate O-methyltransferase CheR [Leptospira soter
MDFRTSLNTIGDAEFEFIKNLVYKQAGIFLAPHKKIMVQSRLNARLRTLGITSFENYVAKLKLDPKFATDEMQELINRITTNKTDFFRENHHFEFLKNQYFPALEQAAANGGQKNLRIWCSASSTGEEPYSIAITVYDYFQTKPGWNCKIYASDIDTQVIATAKKGVYRDERLEPVSDALKAKHFIKTVEKDIVYYEAKPHLKALIDFRQINLLHFPFPISEKLDLIFCRNVVIYFDKPTQKTLFQNFELSLKPKGYLILGHSETMFGISDSFKFLGHTIYQKKD